MHSPEEIDILLLAQQNQKAQTHSLCQYAQDERVKNHR